MVDFMDDKQLLGELKRGNNAAFEFLFKSYYPRLRGYAIRFIEDEETVRDIIQECFLRFWERREMLSAFSLTSLLFSMVRNGCLNYLKHRSIVEKYRVEYLAKVDGKKDSTMQTLCRMQNINYYTRNCRSRLPLCLISCRTGRVRFFC